MDMENNQQNPSTQTQWPAPYAPKPLFELSKRDITFAICGAVISIFLSVLGVFGGFALGYAATAVCMLCLFAVYFAKGGKVCAFGIVCGILALANAAVFLCTSNGSVRFFGVVVSFLLSLVCLDGFINGKSIGNRGTAYLFFRAASTVEHIDITVKSLFSDRNGNRKIIGKVLVGLLCAVPVLIVVVPLLLNSDDAFRGMMDRMFKDTGKTIFKTIVGIMMSVFVASYGFSLKTGRTAKEKEGKFAGLENAYIISFLSTISVCYMLYLFSQLAYFFSAFKGFLPNGEITYAQYARKGFFEMCVIAVINLALVFIAMLLAKKQNGKPCHGIKVLATFIGMFTLVIIATAISKMVLYIGEYGMTVKRVTTSTFMVFLAVVFISVILRVYLLKINVVKTALITAGCVVLILGAVNVNRVCAEYNYKSYCDGRLDTVDIEALYDLGYEGVAYIVKLTDDKHQPTAKEAKRYLAGAYLRDYFDDMRADGDWRESFTVEDLQKREKNKEFYRFSLPKDKAYDALYTYLEEHPDFDSRCPNLLIYG
ncbi:MAG: DUF4173 domain-containing protein [Oscillospiraceae bacterium]|nr:DUF4173 domain-containing protein [Oscillospiraceae bacterium]